MSERDESPDTEALDAVDQPTPRGAAGESATDVPTEALAVVDQPTEALSVVDQPTPPPTEAVRAAVDGPALPYDPAGSITELIAGPLAAGAAAETAADAEAPPAIAGRRARARAEASRRPGILVIVAIALGAVLALVALFLLGTRIPQWTAGPAAEPTPSAMAEPSATPTPERSTAPPRPTAPAAPGVGEWTALAGGECLDPWVDPWQLEFTVVDCAAPHPAQLTWRGPISDDPAAAYPGEQALIEQIDDVCGGATALDLATAGAYADIQVQAAYPVSEEAWVAGERDWFCFVTRASGEPLTGSVAPTR